VKNALELARVILHALGLGADAFIAFLKRLFEAGSIPEDAQNEIITWLTEHLNMAEDKATAIALLIIAEVKSGDPGYNKDHGSLA
jgi:hypothetical protein